MSVEVKKISDENYEVNGKSVFKNTDGQWQCAEPLTETEFTTFRKHIKIKEDNNRYFKKNSQS